MKKLFVIFILLFLSSSVFSQDNLWISYSSQGITSDVCPTTQSPYYYSAVKNNDALKSCKFTWTIINGIIQGAPSSTPTTYAGGSNQIGITWNNIAKKGTIKVALSGCDDTLNNKQKANAELNILSLTDVTPSTLNSGKTQQEIPFGTTQQTYVLDAIVTYPSNGKEVDFYNWTIPNGWYYKGEESIGQAFRTTNSNITVTPNAINSGSINVTGHTNCGFDSSPRKLTITRPAINIQTTAKSTIYYGDITPITLSLSIPNSTSYTYLWNSPSKWNFQGSKTDASVTLIPDGCSGGQVSCTITCNGQSVNATTFTFTCMPATNAITMSGSNSVCSSGATFSLNNLPTYPLTIDWQYNQSLLNASGQNTSSLSVSPLASGIDNILANISIGSCPAIPVSYPNPITIGAPNLNTIRASYTSGGSTYWLQQSNCLLDFTFPGMYSGSIDIVDPCTNVVTWTKVSQSAGTSYVSFSSSNLGKHVNITIKPLGSSAIYKMSAGNQCGSYTHNYTFIASTPQTCLGTVEMVAVSVSVSPNPAAENVTVSVAETQTQTGLSENNQNEKLSIEPKSYTLRVYNNYGLPVYTVRMQGLSSTFSTSNLLNGLYIIDVSDGVNSYKKQMVVKH